MIVAHDNVFDTVLFEKTIYVDDIKIGELHATKFHPDFCYGDKIIEFYGDYWYFNPLIYKSTDKNVKYKKRI